MCSSFLGPYKKIIFYPKMKFYPPDLGSLSGSGNG